jgi:hypothetical protein
LTAVNAGEALSDAFEHCEIFVAIVVGFLKMRSPVELLSTICVRFLRDLLKPQPVEIARVSVGHSRVRIVNARGRACCHRQNRHKDENAAHFIPHCSNWPGHHIPHILDDALSQYCGARKSRSIDADAD